MRYQQRIHEDLRQRFRSEYLGQLMQRADKGISRQFTVGEVVLLGSNNNRRLDWPFAKIEELIPGQDSEQHQGSCSVLSSEYTYWKLEATK